MGAETIAGYFTALVLVSYIYTDTGAKTHCGQKANYRTYQTDTVKIYSKDVLDAFTAAKYTVRRALVH